MSTPAQMYTHDLNGLKGFIPAQPWVVDKVANLDSSVTAANVHKGMVGYLDPTNQTWKLGVGTTTTTSAPMPCFFIQNATDFDVAGDDGNWVGAGSATANTPRLSAVVAGAGYEMETTEYVSATYAPGDLLTANGSGKLVAAAGSGATTICAVVSDTNQPGTSTLLVNSYGSSVLRFWSVYLPRFV